MKCYLCEKGTLEKKDVERKLYGKTIGRFPAEVCNTCNEVFFSEETSKKITKKTKDLGLWGIESTTTVGVSGSNLDVRVNKKLADFYKLKKGQEIKIYPTDERRFTVEVI